MNLKQADGTFTGMNGIFSSFLLELFAKLNKLSTFALAFKKRRLIH
jgi:hypothetical protein